MMLIFFLYFNSIQLKVFSGFCLYFQAPSFTVPSLYSFNDAHKRDPHFIFMSSDVPFSIHLMMKKYFTILQRH